MSDASRSERELLARIAELEQELQQRVRNLEFLSHTAMELAALPPNADLYRHIVQQLHEIVGDAVVGVHSYDADAHSFTCRAATGLGTLITGVMRILGQEPVGVEIRAVNEETVARLLSGTLVRVGDSVTSIVEGQLPRAVCTALDKVLGIKAVYSIGMIRDGRLFASATVMPRKTAGEFDAGLLEAFVGQASMALQRRSVESALGESEERYQRLVDTIPSPVVILQDGVYKYVNRAFIGTFGYTQQDVDDGLSFFRLVREKDKPAVRDRYEARLAGKKVPRTFVLDLVAKDGHLVPCETSAALIQFGGRPADLAILRDLTERVRAEQEREKLEEQLRQSQKLEAIGTLAGGIAHDFNNLLTGVLGYADLLVHEHATRAEVRRAAGVISTAAVRASDLTKQLLGFARKGKLQDVPVDVHSLIADVVSILHRTLDKRIVIVQRFGMPEATTMGDPTQLQQVLMNLAVNARDAMPDGGQLTFETRSSELDAEGSTTHADAAPGMYVTVTVRDTGAGIPESIRDRVLEPFFTTKGPGRGSGLGLSTVYGIVHNHGGWLDIDSEVGAGTAVTVNLPASEVRACVAEAPGRAPEPEGAGRLLVVDDEQSVRSILADMLRSCGYVPVVAANGREAVDYYRDHAGEIDAVVLDVTMPVMDGPECFAELKKLDPDVRVVVSTGHSLEGAPQQMLDDGARSFVGKPYTRAKLTEAVTAALRA